MIKDVTDLKIYCKSLLLLKELNKLYNRLPTREFDLIRQCKKASQSIPANIAEGFAKKNSEKEFKRFLRIALGSSDEMISHLRIIAINNPRLTQEAKTLASNYKIISASTNKLISNWKNYSKNT